MAAQDHPAFYEVAQRLRESVHALEEKYEAVGDDRRVVIRNILEGLTAFTSLYAAERLFPPAEADRLGERLNVALATCLNEFLALAGRASNFSEPPWRAGRIGTA